MLVYSRTATADPRRSRGRTRRITCTMRRSWRLPEVLDRLGVTSPVLFGHSDGASIALIHAAAADRPVAGVIALAPHVKVEDLSVASIREAREAYLSGDLRRRLARHHEHVDSMFWGWNDIWLSEAFRSWNIEALLPRIACPILAIQGEDDEYGTMEQIESIARARRACSRSSWPSAGIGRIAISPSGHCAAVACDFSSRSTRRRPASPRANSTASAERASRGERRRGRSRTTLRT